MEKNTQNYDKHEQKEQQDPYEGLSEQEKQILLDYRHEYETKLSDEAMLKAWKLARMYRQQYRIVGNHTAVKICHWTKKDLKGEGACYKHYFYGVDTHRCLEMSPAITCNQRCKHCWRDTSVYSTGWVGPIDEPQFIVQESIKQRANLLIGFKGNEKVNPAYFEEALQPSHVAISLTGEPCMYPRLPELIEEYFKAGARTVFLVTSGTVPECLEKIKEKGVFPTNIYLSVEGRNKEEYEAICLPVMDHAWEKVQESKRLLRDMPTRTVMRITLMKGMNMDDPKGFLPSIELMQPDYIETKGYMFLGYSMLRMKRENMPNFEEVKTFAEALTAVAEDYIIVDEHKPSNIVLLKRKTPRAAYKDTLYLDKIKQ